MGDTENDSLYAELGKRWAGSRQTGTQKAQPTTTQGDTTPTTPPKDPTEIDRVQAQGNERSAQDTEDTHNNGTTDQDKDQNQGKRKGDASESSVVAVDDDVGGVTRVEPPHYAAVIGRFVHEGRWKDIHPIRDAMVSEAKSKGMHINAARAWTYAKLDQLYPPITPPPQPEPKPQEQPEAAPTSEVPGLYLVPGNWPPLPDNASLQVELGWVQSQRLSVVEERGNAVTVHLDRASTPAPSKAALAWLESSVRSYAKYLDILAKAMAGQQDEQEATRRERMRLDDVRALLDEMNDGK